MARVIVEGPCTYFRIPEENPSGDFGIVPPDAAAKEPLPPCKYTFTDVSGTLISSARYDYALPFGEGLAPVRVGELWGFIDKTGVLVIAPKFESARPFSDGLALVSEGGLFGYVDHRGAYVIKPTFKHAESFAEGHAVIGDAESDYWYIDRTGHQIIPGKFAIASPFFKGVAHVKLWTKSAAIVGNFYAGKYAYIDSTGRQIFTYTR